jgi:hypothetical protein
MPGRACATAALAVTPSPAILHRRKGEFDAVRIERLFDHGVGPSYGAAVVTAGGVPGQNIVR